LTISVKPLLILLKNPGFLSCPVDAPSVDGGVLDDLLPKLYNDFPVSGFVIENFVSLDDDVLDEPDDELLEGAGDVDDDELLEGAGDVDDDELLDDEPESSDI
jgi:hypothetical protein